MEVGNNMQASHLNQENTIIKSIRFDADGFSILGEKFSPDNLQTHEFAQIVVALRPPILVPREIYQENKKSDYLTLQFNKEAINEISTDIFGEYILIDYLTKEEALQLAEFENYSVIHLLSYLHRNFNNSKSSLFFDLNKSLLQCYIIKNDNITLATSFHVSSPIDVLYYLTHTIKEEGLNINALSIKASRCEAAVLEFLQPYFTIELCEL